MAYNHYLPKKIDLTPKRHHGFYVVLFIFGMILPPVAVALRFGIGRDFFINCILTLCGYIPGHGHNFYIQNIRNNTNKARTPKWAIRYGLVDDSQFRRKEAKSQWAKRYDERNPESTLVGQELAEGEEGPNYTPSNPDAPARRRGSEGLWDREEEQFYNDDDVAPNQRNWHYPTNFEGTVGTGGRKKKGRGGDRWERTRSATSGSNGSNDNYGTYPPGGTASTDDDVPEWGRDYGSSKRRSSRGRKNSAGSGSSGPSSAPKRSNNPDDVFRHEF
ncbi:hypothetical protein CcaverHIS002_0502890 [Cutaneotrichosporon cavernicola]|uniref:Uncharacterized protein n=1 Tax=Cutaneotrichosporon cavernicola TaxID=279322 RepID=A0AA48QWU5_9TREE|nr:uncharacterized protein CcaverHIS019_0503460 [Cutaneotrichosporon cavernicola]BEI84888.1 hypothetical protein CcaverHIS002_0502890 [Cutaneotrichosporon cavernicola]BEI92718.1 hypothetical protein CcaverHIS019_0503460 [Cutaneotrichosporon cavernicola]BEJ00495.1 hypothetical protein CcaverHIS631_0503520 [Cutaneotrichosporon cavernicola]BEJ08264.1 hypothetical protein CcaverHIS641_0503490 [Cutaneotrichosporon cavernicola]